MQAFDQNPEHKINAKTLKPNDRFIKSSAFIDARQKGENVLANFDDMLKWPDEELKAFFYFFLEHRDGTDYDFKLKMDPGELTFFGTLIALKAQYDGNCSDGKVKQEILENSLFFEMKKSKISFLLRLFKVLGKDEAAMMSRIKFLMWNNGIEELIQDKNKILGLTKEDQIIFSEQYPRLFGSEHFKKTFWNHVAFSSENYREGNKIPLTISEQGEAELALLEKSELQRYGRIILFSLSHLAIKKTLDENIQKNEKFQYTKENLELVIESYEQLIGEFGHKFNISSIEIPTDDDLDAIGMTRDDLANNLQIIFNLQNIRIPNEYLSNYYSKTKNTDIVNNAIYRIALNYLSFEKLGVREFPAAVSTMRIANLKNSETANKFRRIESFIELQNFTQGKPYEEYLADLLNCPDLVDVATAQLHAELEKENYEKAVNLVFSPINLRKNPQHLGKLVEYIKSPDIDHFYGACMLAGQIILQDNAYLNDFLISNLFPNVESILSVNGSAAVRNILELLSKSDQASNFFKSLLKVDGGWMTINQNPTFLTRFDQFNTYLKDKQNASEPSKFTLDIELKDFPERDLDQLRQEILDNRSIHLSSDGHKLGKTGVDSKLEDILEEIRVTPNKETRKFPDTLACLITIKAAGKTMYWKISKENRLLVRIMENGQQVGEIDLERTSQTEGQKKLYLEVHYLILKKLEYLFVRKKSSDRPLSTLPDMTPANDETPSPDIKPEPTSNEDSVPVTIVDPITPERVENEHHLDLTTPVPSLPKEMVNEDLSEQKDKDKTEAENAKRRVVANKNLALQLLRIDREKLPEVLPKELENLLVYQKVEMDRDEYYEAMKIESFYLKLRKDAIDLKEVYIRKKRAHTSTLPYVEYSLEEPPFHKVVQKKAQTEKMDMKKTLFIDSGEGYGLDLESKPKILQFCVDASPANEALFNAMQQRTAEDISRAIEYRINRALDKNLQAARLKYPAGINGQANEKYLQVQDRMRRLARVLRDMEVKLEMELLSKFLRVETIINETKKKVVLRLPQIFRFEQTFNQGEFVSLEELKSTL